MVAVLRCDICGSTEIKLNVYFKPSKADEEHLKRYATSPFVL